MRPSIKVLGDPQVDPCVLLLAVVRCLDFSFMVRVLKGDHTAISHLGTGLTIFLKQGSRLREDLPITAPGHANYLQKGSREAFRVAIFNLQDWK